MLLRKKLFFHFQSKNLCRLQKTLFLVQKKVPFFWNRKESRKLFLYKKETHKN